MTTQDWLSHKQLMIIRGIGKTPSDTYSAESNPIIVNLMGGPITLAEWSPNIPVMKGGGVWSDSPIADGRQLLAAPVANVTEKLSINIADSSYLGVQKQLNSLNQMVQDCRDYWQTQEQIDPVYLMWAVSCDGNPALPQYALIYNIEVAPEYQPSITPSIRVSITIEREPAWRPIPPGANPKLWTYYVNSAHPQFNVNVASLLTLSDHLITQVINNKHEWSPTALGLQTTPITQNYIEIQASQVPGDAPALVELSIEPSSTSIKPINTYISRTTKPLVATGHDAITRAQALNLNAGDADDAIGSLTKTNVGTLLGVRSNNSAVNYYAGVRTVTGADGAMVLAAIWGTSGPGVPILQLDRELYRGTFAVFIRAFNTSAAAPVLTDMKMQISFAGGNAVESINPVTLPSVYVPLLDTNIDYGLTYMGTITIPFANKSIVSGLGYGRQIQETTSNLRVYVDQQVLVATANRSFTLIDVILVPMDEGMAYVYTTPLDGSTLTSLILDNTGYLARGELQQVAYSFQRNAADAYVTSGGSAQEMRGQSIMLKPGVKQRIYFLNNYFVGTGNPRQGLVDSFTVRLNIVPRWLGIRDQ